MKPNFQSFLKQSSESQNMFIINKNNEYVFTKGPFINMTINEIIINYKSELKELLEEIYQNTDSNTNTKLILKDIVKNYF